MITRRLFLQASALAAAGLRANHAVSQTVVPVAVQTPLGQLAGETRGGIDIFRGVPFAQPPVGPLRFRPPQPALPWTGTRQATKFAGAAPQAEGDPAYQTEDCLRLNIWAPRHPGSYPVLVWVHGGGFTTGTSFNPIFEGTAYAQKGIVVVTVAYRLGVLGFLDLEPLLGTSYSGSANNALKDIVEALKWVNKNISVFGGDPARVTLAGESAGAKLTDLLMGVPSATPFFQQMISESGGAERITPRDEAQKVSRAFGAAWTAQTESSSQSLLVAPVAQLIAVQEQFTRNWPKHFPLRPEIDPDFVPQPPVEAIRAGSTRGKRLLIGTNRDESAYFVGANPADVTASDVANIPIDQLRAIDKKYQKLYPHMPASMRRIRSLSAEEYLVPSMRVIDAHVSAGAEAFLYRLDFPGEGQFAGLAFHSYDLRFVWDHFGHETPSTSARQLAESMQTAWVSFLAGGAPVGPGLPVWPPYTLRSEETMILDTQSHVQASLEKDELALWSGVMTK